MSVEGVPGTAVAAAAAGTLLIYSGIKGHRVTDSLRSLISGKPPPSANAYPVTANYDAASSGSAGTPGGATGSAIADDAMKYQGKGYVWGGAPAKGLGNWDCSSFVNWVLGHDLGRAIPGYSAGSYTGSSHGPANLMYLTYGIGVSGGANAAQAGDLVIFPGHIGIAIGGGKMISALDTRDGTLVTTITGQAGAVISVRRP